MRGRSRWRHLGSLVITAVGAALLAVVPPLPLSAQTAGHGDVPADAFYATPVADLAAASVFDGTECQAGFCPSVPIDRKTMAVWMVRVLDGVDPPAVSQTRFNDLDARSFYAPFIERMAELGVTQGCGDGSGFCPDRTVTRAEMAAFVSRAYDLPDGPDPGFSDVPPNAWYAADAARLAASRISVGCGDATMFCPETDTTRAQMATFLWRAENPDWQSSIDDQSSTDATSSSQDEVTLQLSSDPDGDTFTFLGARSSDPSVSVRTQGDFSVPVYLCGPSEFFDGEFMATAVEFLNEEVAPIFNHQSSGLVDVTFQEGSILSPDVPWDTLHRLFEDSEDNPCVNAARAISDVRYELVIAYDWSVTGCSGVASRDNAFLRVNPYNGASGRIRGPAEFASLTYASALYGTGHHLFEMRPLASYGRLSLFSSIAYAPSWTVVLACYQRERLGWPVDENSPPCHRLTPSGSNIQVAPDERSATISWTEPTFTDGASVIGYTLRLYEHEPELFNRWSVFGRYANSGQRDGSLASRSALAHDARSYSFEDLDPASSYSIELDLRSRYGRTIVRSGLFRVMTSGDVVGVEDLSPYGFTLSVDPLAGVSEYLLGLSDDPSALEDRVVSGGPVLAAYGIGNAHFIVYYFRAEYGYVGFLSRGLAPSYVVEDESGRSYLTIDHGNDYRSGFLGEAESSFWWSRDDVAGSSPPQLDTHPPPWYTSVERHRISLEFKFGVQPDTTYAITIVACGGEAAGLECHRYATLTVVTPPAPSPNPPDEIFVTEVGNTWVDLAWHTVPGATAYEVCGLYSHCIHPLIASSEVDSRVLREEKITGLEPETTYAVEVKSCVLAESVGGPPGSFLCGDPVSLSVTTAASQTGIAPGRPGPVTATVGDNWATLEWDDVDGADEYTFETIHDFSTGPIPGRVPVSGSWRGTWRGGDHGDPPQLIAPPARRITFKFMQPETEYTFELRACRTVGSARACGDPRTVIVTTTAQPRAQPPAPDAPTGFSVANIYAADGCIDATWDPVPGAVEYKLSLNGNPYPSSFEFNTVVGIPPSRGDWCGLDPNVTYTIGVSVCKAVGVSIVCSADATRSVRIGT